MNWDRLLHIDRRIIFVIMAFAVGVPLVVPVTLDAGENPRSKALYEYIEGLDAGDVIIVAFDYGPASMPELNPMAAAVIRHALSRNLRVVTITLIPEGTALAENILTEVGQELDKQAGVDYVNLGYKPGFLAVILGMATGIGNVFKSDVAGTPYQDLPITEGLRTYDDVALIVDLASSDTPLSWVLYAHERYGVALAAGVTAVMAMDYYPYLQSNQLIGLLNGLKGAAEYEKLIDHAGNGTRGMVAQSAAQSFIIITVILVNIVYVLARRQARRHTEQL
jgi:hypothetical protein